ncbi:MAG: hypothetical protein GF375_03025 [Candidatus Omnitrophica bacterium]|nr:hypothetical protein [Candidatus Omnitrophota bacterium]
MENILPKIAILDKRIKSFSQGYRQNLAFLGNDKEEISYMLENYFRDLKIPNLVCIHINSSYSSPRELLKSVVFSALSNYSSRSDTIDKLINYCGFSLTATVELIKKLLRKDMVSFAQILEVIDTFIKESKSDCVFIIEEFLGLEKIFGNFYQEFSKFIVSQRNCVVILTSSSPQAAEKVLMSDLNLLFGNFEKIFVSESSFVDNFLYLRRTLEPLKPSPLFLSFFVNICGSSIIYYDIFAEAIKSHYRKDSEEQTIMKILSVCLCNKETYLFQKFIGKINLLDSKFKDTSSVIKILLALGDGYLRKKELLSLKIYNSKELKNRLQKLIDLNFIENLGNLYRPKDLLFSFWLSTVFKLYFSPYVANQKRRENMWIDNIYENINLFKEEFMKDKLKKVLQLFSSFRNDTVSLGNNRYKLPLIEKAKIISYPQENFHLLVGEGKQIVFAGIKEQPTDDRDIFRFLEKGSNIKGKKVKKIFISLGEISLTAKVLAKNNKLITWDINEVNKLLGVYNRPMVTCNLSAEEQTQKDA